MSDPRYAPYGVDDDPFLTHPAGPGGARLRSDAHYQPRLRADFAHQPRPRGDDQAYWNGDAPYNDAPFKNAAQNETGYDQGYDPAPQFAPQPMHQPAPQQGNFRPRPEMQPYAAQLQKYPPQPRPEPRVHMRAPYENTPYDQAGYGQTGYGQTGGHTQNSYAQNGQAQQGGYDMRFGSAAPMGQNPVRGYAPLPNQQHYAAPHPVDQTRAAFVFAGPQMGQIVQWAGALCTVLAIFGAVSWGYQLAVRDANGIPVVRASVQPLRIAPEVPGGEVSANQGLAVNSIPATGSAAAVPEQITLAPQAGELAAEDMAQAQPDLIEQGSFAASLPDPAGAGSAEGLAGASDQVLALPETGGISGGIQDLTALPDALPEDMPLTDAEAVERALEMALAEGGDLPAETASEAAVVSGPQPAGEPVSMSNTDPTAPPTAELDPATIALGTPMVQFGAFESVDIARAEWANLQTRFTELMAGKALVIEKAKSGGRDFYRLRAHGFSDAKDTQRFCNAILAESSSCLIVDQR